ncbi:MAG: hypothetical protein GEU26_15765 [Nitrososphaeraceae archaeon]|nr:hypothetical protein [Nitrososphaeraceae archaeon]
MNKARILISSIIGVTILLMTTGAMITQLQQFVDAVGTRGLNDRAYAPSVISGDNVYIAWWNGTEGRPDRNIEVFLRASEDSGATFGDKINLSNSTDADSINAEITAEGNGVLVTWWELNATSEEPVARISTDEGQAFGEMIRLSTNGTIGEAEVDEEEEEEEE